MKIEVVLLDEARVFLYNLDEKARNKVLADIRKTEAGFRGDWFKKMSGTDDIWEFRTLFNKTYYRVFAFWYKKDGKETLIVCTNGLVKKTDKTPSGEIDRAERIKQDYLKDK
jgi:phage-related protein